MISLEKHDDISGKNMMICVKKYDDMTKGQDAKEDQDGKSSKDEKVKSDANNREKKKDDDLPKGLDAEVYDVNHKKAANLI